MTLGYTLIRSTDLKAFFRSSCSSAEPGGACFAQRRIFLAKSSAALATCSGHDLLDHPLKPPECVPTAIGRTPSPFFGSGTRRAAVNSCIYSGPKWPLATARLKLASASRIGRYADGQMGSLLDETRLRAAGLAG